MERSSSKDPIFNTSVSLPSPVVSAATHSAVPPSSSDFQEMPANSTPSPLLGASSNQEPISFGGFGSNLPISPGASVSVVPSSHHLEARVPPAMNITEAASSSSLLAQHPNQPRTEFGPNSSPGALMNASSSPVLGSFSPNLDSIFSGSIGSNIRNPSSSSASSQESTTVPSRNVTQETSSSAFPPSYSNQQSAQFGPIVASTHVSGIQSFPQLQPVVRGPAPIVGYAFRVVRRQPGVYGYSSPDYHMPIPISGTVYMDSPGGFISLIDEAMSEDGSRMICNYIRSIIHSDNHVQCQFTFSVAQDPERALNLMTHEFGSRVIKDCFTYLRPGATEILYYIVFDNIHLLAVDPNGYTVANSCIQFSEGREQLLNRVSYSQTALLELSHHDFGNYVVQKGIKLSEIFAERMCTRLSGHFLYLATEKGGSHIVEKCLRFRYSPILYDVLKDEEGILRLAGHKIGHHVILTALQVTMNDDKGWFRRIVGILGERFSHLVPNRG
ncbi:OLC1v1037573C1 [Oldenlandia corymbosa var. corymbosa]|uniref:OLC1v1037573C1 n=1 Tax=Oldenlandia corymbosa var. corymbosa TaxID=529605 RepID=A0AAV1CYC6_OLDCO|nr:OLC1v1037573C1 [Oldenlandia corymbosa var. corymbosa]